MPYMTLLPDKPLAVFVFHHGYAEHCWRYRSLFLMLNEWGVACYAYDVHGHGKAEPEENREKWLVNRWEDLVDDMVDFA